MTTPAPDLELTFRDATPDDVPALAVLIQSAYRGDASRAGWTTEADLLGGQRTDEGTIAGIIGRPGTRLIAVELDGGLVACCQLDRRDGHAHFGLFAVRPTLQAGGLGRRIIAEAERIARDEWGATEMRMSVITQREDLIAWYVRRGYTRTGEMSPFPYEDLRFGLPQRDDLAFESLVKPL